MGISIGRKLLPGAVLLAMFFCWLGSSAAFAAPAPSDADWAEQSPANHPIALEGATMVYDPVNENLVLFGGSGMQRRNDTWTWDGSNWTQMSPDNIPPARYGAGMAFDPVSQKVILFGGNGFGVGNGTMLNDTWAWDGSNWTQLSPASSPTGRVFTEMTTDETAGNILLFGGFNATSLTFSNQTWTWNGSNWIQMSPATSPSARYGSGLASNPISGNPVLFGGIATGDQIKQDTWTWSGSNWTQMTPAQSPPADLYPSFAADLNTGNSILFVGYEEGQTWSWDGSQWTKLSPATSPHGRAQASMAFDPTIGKMVLFGGYSGSFVRYDDTWTYGKQPPSATITSPADGAAFSIGEQVPTTFSCKGTGLTSCLDSNGASQPTGSLDTSTLGSHQYSVTATSADELTATDQITYEVVKATPQVAATGATAGKVGGLITANAELASAHNPTGSVTLRAWDPSDFECFGEPVFTSAPIPVTENGTYGTRGFSPDMVGSYRWKATYSGDASNEPATSACNVSGSISTVKNAAKICPAIKLGFSLSSFRPSRPFGNAEKIPGVLARFKTGATTIAKISPTLRYSNNGRTRTVELKTRTIRIDGSRKLRFRVPPSLPFRSKVTLRIRAKLKVAGSANSCFQASTESMRARVVAISSRVALRNRR